MVKIKKNHLQIAVQRSSKEREKKTERREGERERRGKL